MFRIIKIYTSIDKNQEKGYDKKYNCQSQRNIHYVKNIAKTKKIITKGKMNKGFNLS